MKPLALLTVLSLIGTVWAGPGRVAPDRPRWGAKMVLTYDPAAEGAKFSSDDPVHFVAWLATPNASPQVWGKMRFEDGVFRHEMPVKEDLGHIDVFFVTPSGYDSGADASSMVYRPDGVPACGAHQHRMNSKQWSDLFEQEIALYPHNYWAYVDRWTYARQEGDERFPQMVEQDLTAIASEVDGRPVDYLFARTMGLLQLGREAEARAALREMANEYPDAELLRRAVSFYEYLTYVNEWKGEGPEEVTSLSREVAAAHPRSHLARHRFRWLALDEAFPLGRLEAVHDAWVADEPDHPTPHLGLAEAYNLRGVKLERAGESVERSIELMLQGKLRFYFDISGKLTAGTLPWAYDLAGEVALERGRYAASLAYVRAAQTLRDRTDAKPYLLEGRLWRALSNHRRAEEALLKAWNENPELAEPELRELYAATHGDTAGFDEWLQSSATVAGASTQDELRTAPPLRVTTLDGERIEGAALLGQVVVLNFWFIACAPCIVEMPSLNELVRDFAGRPVTFLAMGLDGADDLRDFTKEKEFLYRIVPDAGEVHAAFEVAAYPSHVIVGPEGRIRHVLIGGDRETDDRLRSLIERLLD